MTSFLWSFFWGQALLPLLAVFVAWFINGLRKALTKPEFKLLSHSQYADVDRLEIERQERCPPWRTLHETWVGSSKDLGKKNWVRSSDGYQPDVEETDRTHPLQERLNSLLLMAKREKAHTDACIADDSKP